MKRRMPLICVKNDRKLKEKRKKKTKKKKKLKKKETKEKRKKPQSGIFLSVKLFAEYSVKIVEYIKRICVTINTEK